MMVEVSLAGPTMPIQAIVVTHESGAVIGSCLRALALAAPRRGVAITVVDNASTDDSATQARQTPGAVRVIRLEHNRGFAAGVNAGLRDAMGDWVAIVNPDAALPIASVDRLADVLERHPHAAIV